MVHFLERNHTDRFVTFMDKFMPIWRNYKQELNQFILKNEEWQY
jgi:predicted metal-dependent hydrolase